jgi:uncharacterized RDD family membrane protein YckC
MSTSRSESPDEVISYVGFWPRVGAALIDGIVVSIVLEILFRVLGLDIDTGDTVPTDVESMQAYLLDPHLWLQLVLSLVLPLIAIIILWRRLKATPGKMAIGAEVVDARTLGPLSTGQSIVRGLGYFVSTLPFCLGLIWVAFDARKQGWHDKLAGTVVIRKPRKP